MKHSLLFCALAAAVVGLAACGSSTSPDGGVTTLQMIDTKVGTGTAATNGRSITVNYTGYLYNASTTDHKGTKFDSSLDPGRAPFVFTLGAGQVIAGWDQGIVGMRVGGARTLIIPPSLGYGSRGSGPIPGNASLVFDVDLLDVR